MIENVALVLEGGGFRGCYTAGAMKWLHDNGILFKYSVSISATAVHSFFYLTGRIDEMHEMTVKSVTDPKMIGLSAILTEGNICAFEYM
ncbi:MAG: patatin family protein, partial [Erysipelotrichaceae bacterium]|nr:patatin family protein [Erysipelotrichaceae bacterium]